MHNKFFVFATANTPYVSMAYTCKASFSQFDCDVEVVTFPKRDTWMQSCLRRSVLLYSYAEKYPAFGIGLLDADLECRKEPMKLLNFQGDVAVHDLGFDDEKWLNAKSNRYSAGVIIFGTSIHGRECLRLWAKACSDDEQKNEHLREQVYLYDAIEAIRFGGGLVTNIGSNYNQSVSSDTVILHHVASRKLREQMGGGM